MKYFRKKVVNKYTYTDFIMYAGMGMFAVRFPEAFGKILIIIGIIIVGSVLLFSKGHRK